MSSAPDLTSRILRHERALVAGSITLLVALSWLFLSSGAGMETGGGMADMAQPSLSALILMWWVMMAGMMLPSATPAILLYARVRASRAGGGAIAPSWLFVAGYLMTWLLFSASAASAQYWLASGSMALASRPAGSALLIAAGVYQLTPFKAVCLNQCRSPAAFISRHWSPGAAGALQLGALHGAVCLGCCWMLMSLLFVGGVMNFLWIILLAVIVGVEKLLPRGDQFGRAAGVALIAWGTARLLT